MQQPGLPSGAAAREHQVLVTEGKMQSQVSVLLHPPGRGLLCPHIPWVSSHGQLSWTFYCIFSHFTFLKASPTTFPLPSIPATFLWPPPSHLPASLFARLPTPLLAPASLRPAAFLGILFAAEPRDPRTHFAPGSHLRELSHHVLGLSTGLLLPLSLSKEKVGFLPLRSLCQPDDLKIGACSQS